MGFSQEVMAEAEQLFQTFHCNHNILAKLVHILFRQKYCFLLQEGCLYKYTDTWTTGKSIVYELRNLLSDDVMTFIKYNWTPRMHDMLDDLEYMLGNHEDKLAILAEMEARFMVSELPTKLTTAHVGPKIEKVPPVQTSKPSNFPSRK